MPLQTATSAFELGRRRWSSPKQCYSHCLRTTRSSEMNDGEPGITTLCGHAPLQQLPRLSLLIVNLDAVQQCIAVVPTTTASFAVTTASTSETLTTSLVIYLFRKCCSCCRFQATGPATNNARWPQALYWHTFVRYIVKDFRQNKHRPGNDVEFPLEDTGTDVAARNVHVGDGRPVPSAYVVALDRH